MGEKFNAFRKTLGIWVWVILIGIAILTWRGISSSNQTLKVETLKVEKGNIVESVSTSGTVQADKYAVLTFPAGGKVVSVSVTTGQKVLKGQFIAQIDTVALNAAYQNAQNTYRATQAAVDLEHDNDKNYGAGETFSQKSTRTAAEVANDNAYNNVLAAQDALKNAIIFAPFSGIMDTVSPSSPGINLAAAAANYTIVDPTSVYFDAEVEETDLPNIAVGQRVDVKLDAYPDEIIHGVIETIGMVAFTSSTGGNAYHVRIILPENINEKFRVGMGGDADIIFATLNNVLKVPSSAVINETNNYVWLIQNGRAKKVQVEIGGASADETEIRSGVSEGDIVISQPTSDIKDGAKVSITN